MESELSRHKDDEAILIDLIERIEEKHGFIPRHVSEELSRVLEIKMERINKLRSKIDSTARRDVEDYLEDWKDEEGNLIMILHAIQNKHGYVPREIAMELASALGIRLARIYEVLTFYHYFKLVAPGDHNLSVCMGTACYLKGGNNLSNALQKLLNIKEGETSSDRKWHLDMVRCIGCCGMAPALVIDGKTHGKVKNTDIPEILEKTLKKSENA